MPKEKDSFNQRSLVHFSKEELLNRQYTRKDLTSCKLCGDICKWDLKFIPHRGYVCCYCYIKYTEQKSNNTDKVIYNKLF